VCRAEIKSRKKCLLHLFIYAIFIGLQKLMERIFHAFDRRGEGVIDGERWVLGMSVLLKGSLPEKRAYCFNVRVAYNYSNLQLCVCARSVVQYSRPRIKHTFAPPFDCWRACKLRDSIYTRDYLYPKTSFHTLLYNNSINSPLQSCKCVMSLWHWGIIVIFVKITVEKLIQQRGNYREIILFFCLFLRSLNFLK